MIRVDALAPCAALVVLAALSCAGARTRRCGGTSDWNTTCFDAAPKPQESPMRRWSSPCLALLLAATASLLVMPQSARAREKSALPAQSILARFKTTLQRKLSNLSVPRRMSAEPRLTRAERREDKRRVEAQRATEFQRRRAREAKEVEITHLPDGRVRIKVLRPGAGEEFEAEIRAQMEARDYAFSLGVD